MDNNAAKGENIKNKPFAPNKGREVNPALPPKLL